MTPDDLGLGRTIILDRGPTIAFHSELALIDELVATGAYPAADADRLRLLVVFADRMPHVLDEVITTDGTRRLRDLGGDLLADVERRGLIRRVEPPIPVGITPDQLDRYQIGDAMAMVAAFGDALTTVELPQVIVIKFQRPVLRVLSGVLDPAERETLGRDVRERLFKWVSLATWNQALARQAWIPRLEVLSHAIAAARELSSDPNVHEALVALVEAGLDADPRQQSVVRKAAEAVLAQVGLAQRMRAAEARAMVDEVWKTVARGTSSGTTSEKVISPAERAQALGEAREAAALVLAASDPLLLVEQDLRQIYGGDLRPPLTTYLCATTRVLSQQFGSMPCHAMLLGSTTTGKSYALGATLRLLNADGAVIFDAGSPKAAIYDPRSVQHRCIVFSEADAIPRDDDSVVLSAIRTLLQEHVLRWSVVERNKETGRHDVRIVERRGPSTLLTSGTRRLPPEMDSRVFVIEVVDEAKHVAAALDRQAALHLDGVPAPDPALVSFQQYLQLKAPWHVQIPFVGKLAKALAGMSGAARVLRDYQKLLSLIRAVAVLREAHRQRDAAGRVLAELDDYRAVHSLVSHMYEGSATGASKSVRAVVDTVWAQTLAYPYGMNYTQIAHLVKLSVATVSRSAEEAVRRGWLINNERRDYRPARLVPGEPIPASIGLPSPEALDATVVRLPHHVTSVFSPNGQVKTDMKTPDPVE